MGKRARIFVVCAGAASLWLQASSERSHAETSSWSSTTVESRPTPGARTREEKSDLPQTKPRAAKSQAVPKSAAPRVEQGLRGSVAPASAVTAPENRLPVGKITPSGDDAAYIAFDQGQYLTALELAKAAAKKGEPQAHTLVGRILAEGKGVPVDLQSAAKWYAAGAKLGDREAAFAYALLLAEGRGIKKDRPAAARFFEQAAAKGHAEANYNLGLLFLHGDGKPENVHRAAAHIRYAAEQGIPAAEYALGSLYATGNGVAANAFEAARWIGKAAEDGYLDAEVEFGVLLLRGHGVKPDAKLGAQMLLRAARKGSPVAQNRLAHCFANGLGVEKDAVEAASWHLVAKAAGKADKVLDGLVGKLSTADRTKAEQAAQAFSVRAPRR